MLRERERNEKEQKQEKDEAEAGGERSRTFDAHGHSNLLLWKGGCIEGEKKGGVDNIGEGEDGP